MQLKGHPLKKMDERIPGPSSREFPFISITSGTFVIFTLSLSEYYEFTDKIVKHSGNAACHEFHKQLVPVKHSNCKFYNKSFNKICRYSAGGKFYYFYYDTFCAIGFIFKTQVRLVIYANATAQIHESAFAIAISKPQTFAYNAYEPWLTIIVPMPNNK